MLEAEKQRRENELQIQIRIKELLTNSSFQKVFKNNDKNL